MTPIPVELVLLPAERAVLDLQLLVLGARHVRPARRPAGRCGRCGTRRSTCARSARGPARPARPRRPGPMRRAALREAERWVRAHQEADGSWGGIQPPWVWSILMLAALGHGFEDETLRRAVEGWEGFTIDEGDRLRPEACQSPVWDTGLAVLALRDAGLGPEHPALVARRRLAPARGGDGRGRLGRAHARSSRPGGWAFEFENDLYPDVDDTAVVALALRRCHRGHDAVERGLAWTAGHAVAQRRLGRLRRRQRGLLALQAPVLRLRQGHRRAERRRHRARARGARSGGRLRRRGRAAGSTGCSREQEADGSWFGRWGVNHVYGTGAALPALEACGIEPGHRAFRRAVAWLDSVQNEDGGFGEDIRSYADPRLARPRSQHAFPNGVGAISLRRRRRGGQPGRPSRRRMVMQHTTGKRRLGGRRTSPARAFRLTS